MKKPYLLQISRYVFSRSSDGAQKTDFPMQGGHVGRRDWFCWSAGVGLLTSDMIDDTLNHITHSYNCMAMKRRVHNMEYHRELAVIGEKECMKYCGIWTLSWGTE